jgi:cbb3-type cytochrome oxidase subunit 3
MELIIIFLLICFIVWIVWRVRAKIRAEKSAALDDAWRTVLSDPN